MNREYKHRAAQSIVPVPDRQFLMEESLERNMIDIERLIMDVTSLCFSWSDHSVIYDFLYF